LQRAAAAVDAALEETNVAAARAALPEMEAALRQVLDGIATLESGTTSPASRATAAPTAQADLAALTPLLDRLEQLLQEADFQAQSQLAEILQAAQGTDLGSGLEAVKVCLDGYDFDGALEKLRALRAG